MTERVLVCFGDSNTHGNPPSSGPDPRPRYGPDVRWPGVLATALGPGWRVHEEGLPGRTTVHPDPVEGAHVSGLAALPIVLGTHSPVDVLVIMLGTNDLKARFSAEAADIAASVGRLVLTARSFCASSGRLRRISPGRTATGRRDAGYEPVDVGGTDGCSVMEAPRRDGAVYGEEYRLDDARAVVKAVRAGRPIPPTPSYGPLG